MDAEAASELLELSRALRAHLEWHKGTGSQGLAADPVPLRALAPLEPISPAVNPGPAVAPVREAEEARGARSSVQKEIPKAAPSPSAASGLSEPERLRRLEQLQEEVRDCTRCALSEARTNTVFARGSGASGLCFVGEAPGVDEDAQGLPFVGVAGQLLDRMIQAMGLSRDEVYVCNIVKCRPPNNRKPEPSEMAACSPYLIEQIELIQPQVLIALGATAVQGLLATTEGIMRLRGKWKLYRGRIALMPTFHPAYLLRNPAAKREVWQDLQAVLRHLGRPLPERER